MNNDLNDLREEVMNVLDNEILCSNLPLERILFLIDELDSENTEENFICSVVFLMTKLAERASDYEMEIFNEPLSKEKAFVFHNVRASVFSNLQRTQPLAPLFSFFSQNQEMHQIFLLCF